MVTHWLVCIMIMQFAYHTDVKLKNKISFSWNFIYFILLPTKTLVLLNEHRFGAEPRLISVMSTSLKDFRVIVVEEFSIIDNDVICNVNWDKLYDALDECNVVEIWLACKSGRYNHPVDWLIDWLLDWRSSSASSLNVVNVWAQVYTTNCQLRKSLTEELHCLRGVPVTKDTEFALCHGSTLPELGSGPDPLASYAPVFYS